MRKSTIFISAVLTTFALVLLYGVVSAYRGAATNVAEAAVLPTTTTAPEPTATDEPVPTPTQTMITPEQAAQVAAQVVGNSDLLSAESSNFNGLDAYMITFTNHDVVYVGLDGQILSVQVAPVVVNVAPPVQQKKNKSNGGGGGGGSSTQSNHEDHTEHDD